jgi:hypothetical protein
MPARCGPTCASANSRPLLALAVGDTDAIREGCEWVRQFEQLDAGRRRTYRCIETLLDMEDPDALLREASAGRPLQLDGDDKALDLAKRPDRRRR